MTELIVSTRYGDSNSPRHKLVQSLDELKGVDVVDLGADKTLEDTEETLDLVALNDNGGTAHEERLPHTHEGGYVAALLPELGAEERRKESLVLGRQVVRRVQLEKLGENLEDVRDELWMSVKKA
jgi:hypothetical protein